MSERPFEISPLPGANPESPRSLKIKTDSIDLVAKTNRFKDGALVLTGFTASAVGLLVLDRSYDDLLPGELLYHVSEGFPVGFAEMALWQGLHKYYERKQRVDKHTYHDEILKTYAEPLVDKGRNVLSRKGVEISKGDNILWHCRRIQFKQQISS